MKNQYNQLNILKPLAFESFMEKGGSTKPWLITGLDTSTALPESVPCVLKLFKPAHVLNANSIGKECLCSLLAEEFDLITPQPYLVDPFDVGFKTLVPAEGLKILTEKHKGLTFCSRLMDATILREDLKTSVYKIQDCALVFAFDCLIVNLDRGGYHNKANLMVDDNGLVLIDHELTFPFSDGNSKNAFEVLMDRLNKGEWAPSYRMHLFYNTLKNYKGTKKSLFDTFEEYLGKLDLLKVNNLLKELSSLDISCGQHQLLIDYLYTLKLNANKFSKILLNLIS